MAEFIKINAADNVAVAIHDVEAGGCFGIDGIQIVPNTLIPAGHKVALAGFLIYGPQALLGVTAANIATKKAAFSAVGLIGFMSYLSTIVTGVVFGALADKFGGWGWIFITMGGLSVIGTVLILSLWNLKEGTGE